MVVICVIEPGVYCTMNDPAALVGSNAQNVAAAMSQWGFHITPK